MRKALQLNRSALIYQPHLNLAQTFFTSRLKSDSSKSSDTTKKETECKSNKDAAPDKKTKDAVASKPTKDAAAGKQPKDASSGKTPKDSAAGKKPKDSAASKSTKDAVASKPTKDSAAAKQPKDASAGKQPKDAATSKTTKDAASTKSTKEAESKKEETPPKDETVITGGSQCKPKTPPQPPPVSQSKGSQSKGKNLQPSNATKKKVPLTKIQGGAIVCKLKSDKKPTLAKNHAGQYQKLSLFFALPLIAILTLLVFTNRMEEDRLEFKNYNYMYKREKRFSFGDGKRSAFHNGHYNALPPDGYEDEIDEEGLGQEPEAEKDRKSRLKEFEKVFKKWKKHAGKRDAQMQKQMAAPQ